MTSVLAGLWLFGGLLGGDDGGHCRRSAEEADRAIRAIEQQWPLRPAADPVTDYVQRLGMRLVGAFDSSPDDRWRFSVVRNLEPSAFALGGRRFVVSDGLIAFVPTEDELAAVLAHEISHERLGHFCRPRSAARQRIPMGSVVQHFELEAELAADSAAVALLSAAGFVPRSMHRILSCLAKRPGADGAQLRTRLAALGGGGAPRIRRLDQERSPQFMRIRAGVAAEIGQAAVDCR